jgi:hypothetical protein
VVENRIEVGPYYEIDLKRRPRIAVMSSGREEMQFLGDYGGKECVSWDSLPAHIYADFDAIAVTDDRTGLIVSAGLKLENVLWINMIISHGEFSTSIESMLVRDGEDTIINLKDALPEGTALRGWKAQSQIRQKGIEYNASAEKVNVSIYLTTSGDASINRMLSTIVRAVLKKGRMTFEQAGMMTPLFSYSPVLLTESNEMEFESTFTIEATMVDAWIEREFWLNDKTTNIDIQATAVPVDKEVNDDVQLW